MGNLPPLPQKVQIDKHIPSGYVILGYTADQMRKYAEAAVVAERERCIAVATYELDSNGQAQAIEAEIRAWMGLDGA